VGKEGKIQQRGKGPTPKGGIIIIASEQKKKKFPTLLLERAVGFAQGARKRLRSHPVLPRKKNPTIKNWGRRTIGR